MKVDSSVYSIDEIVYLSVLWVSELRVVAYAKVLHLMVDSVLNCVEQVVDRDVLIQVRSHRWFTRLCVDD